MERFNSLCLFLSTELKMSVKSQRGVIPACFAYRYCISLQTISFLLQVDSNSLRCKCPHCLFIFGIFSLIVFPPKFFKIYIYIKGPFSCSFLFLQAKVMAEVRDREHSRQLKSLLDQNFLVSFWSSEAHNSE